MDRDTITLGQVLALAQHLAPAEQEQLRAALALSADNPRTIQQRKNQAAIALLDSWLTDEAEYDDNEGGESWEEMLRSLDASRFSTRKLFPDLTADT